jgi:hypothetical protein
VHADDLRDVAKDQRLQARDAVLKEVFLLRDDFGRDL